MNNTPPPLSMMSSMVFLILASEPPMTLSTRSARPVSTNVSAGRTSAAHNSLAITRAIVVLPVPGGPLRTRCSDLLRTGRPRASRALSARTLDSSRLICSLTSVMPTKSANSASASALSSSRRAEPSWRAKSRSRARCWRPSSRCAASIARRGGGVDAVAGVAESGGDGRAQVFLDPGDRVGLVEQRGGRAGAAQRPGGQRSRQQRLSAGRGDGSLSLAAFS